MRTDVRSWFTCLSSAVRSGGRSCFEPRCPAETLLLLLLQDAPRSEWFRLRVQAPQRLHGTGYRGRKTWLLASGMSIPVLSKISLRNPCWGPCKEVNRRAVTWDTDAAGVRNAATVKGYSPPQPCVNETAARRRPTNLPVAVSAWRFAQRRRSGPSTTESLQQFACSRLHGGRPSTFSRF